MIYGITGVKPDKLVIGDLNGYDRRVYKRLVALAARYFDNIRPSKVISGMGLGWEQACVEACIGSGIKYDVIIASLGQDNKWNREYQAKYYEMLGKAHDIKVMSKWYNDSCYNSRNMTIVENSDVILTLGQDDFVRMMLRYARINDKQIVDLWNTWEKYK